MESVQKTAKDQENVKQRLDSNELHNATLLKLSMRDISNVTLVLPLSGKSHQHSQYISLTNSSLFSTL